MQWLASPRASGLYRHGHARLSGGDVRREATEWDDPEMQARIARHQAERGPDWLTLLACEDGRGPLCTAENALLQAAESCRAAVIRQRRHVDRRPYGERGRIHTRPGEKSGPLAEAESSSRGLGKRRSRHGAGAGNGCRQAFPGIFRGRLTRFWPAPAATSCSVPAAYR